jgi:hypothetical protein
MKKEEVITEIERYFVFPGQACAYMVGCQTILSLREKAQSALGNKFDLKQFHDGMKLLIIFLFIYFHAVVVLSLFSGVVKWSIAIEYIRKHN